MKTDFEKLKNKIMATGMFLFWVLYWVGAHQALASNSVGLGASVGASSSLHTWDDPNHTASTYARILPAYTFGAEKYSLSARAGFSRNLGTYDETLLEDTQLTLRRVAFRLNPYLGISPGTRLVVATSKTSIKRDSLYAAASLQPRLEYSMDAIRVPVLRNFSGFFQLSGTKGFHQYETSRTGESNTEYSFSPLLETVYSVTEKIFLTFDVGRSFGITYSGALRQNFVFNQEVAVLVGKNMSVALGHGNQGSAFKENGVDSNVALIDSQNSNIYGEINLSI